MSITSNNYKVARDILDKRYNNSKLLINALLQKLITEPRNEKENSKALKRLVNNFNKNLCGLKNVQSEQQGMWNSIIVHLLVSKLGNTARRDWELDASSSTIDSYETLSNFLEKRIRALHSATPLQVQNKNAAKQNQDSHAKTHVIVGATSDIANKNIERKKRSCHGEHYLFQCETFKSKSVKERNNLVKEKNLCFNCMKGPHLSEKCLTSSRCRECNLKHHILLHFERKLNEKKSENCSGGTVFTISSVTKEASTVFLATALVHAEDSNGYKHMVHALIDLDSQVHVIITRLFQKLNLPLYLNLSLSLISLFNSIEFCSRSSAFFKRSLRRPSLNNVLCKLMEKTSQKTTYTLRR